MQEEGVIKFDLRYTHTDANAALLPDELRQWRARLWQAGLIGQQAGRYGGLGYGNVSCRLAPFAAPAGQRSFLISCSQTGHLPDPDAAHYAVVSSSDIGHNRVVAHGPCQPSSEALTHAVLYDQDAAIRAVLHVHAPLVWQRAQTAGLPVTDRAAAYGTPAMAGEVARLFRTTDVRQQGIFAMGGHADGIVAFGSSVGQAGDTLLYYHTHFGKP